MRSSIRENMTFSCVVTTQTPERAHSIVYHHLYLVAHGYPASLPACRMVLSHPFEVVQLHRSARTEFLISSVIANYCRSHLVTYWTPPCSGTTKTASRSTHVGVYEPTIPIPARRLTVPTRGVTRKQLWALVIVAKTEDDRFWRWEEEPTGDEPPGDRNDEYRVAASGSCRYKTHRFSAACCRNPECACSTRPDCDDGIYYLTGQQSLFSKTFRALPRIRRMLSARSSRQCKLPTTSASFRRRCYMCTQRNSERIMKVNDARGKKILTDDHAKQVTGKLFGVLNSDLGGGKQSLGERSHSKMRLIKCSKARARKP